MVNVLESDTKGNKMRATTIIIKKILLFIVEPFRRFGTSGITERITKFASKHKYVLYILAFVITIFVIYFIYFY